MPSGKVFAIAHPDGTFTDRELWRDILGDDFPDDDLRDLGGPGSGNFGHAGRPGEVGGSGGGDETPSQLAKVTATPFGKTLSLQTWFHGTSRPVTGQLKDPLFLTTDPEGADWYTDRNPRAVGGSVYPATVDVKNPFTVNNYEDAVRLKEIVERAGVSVELHNDPKYGWTWQADLQEHGPYSGDNPVDVMYVPAVRQQLLEAGYDGFYVEGDPLEHGKDISALVPIRAEAQVRGKYTKKALTRAAGGPGSGNYGHAGRPGEIGGSAPEESGNPDESVATSLRLQKEAQVGADHVAALVDEAVKDANFTVRSSGDDDGSDLSYGEAWDQVNSNKQDEVRSHFFNSELENGVDVDDSSIVEDIKGDLRQDKDVAEETTKLMLKELTGEFLSQTETLPLESPEQGFALKGKTLDEDTIDYSTDRQDPPELDLEALRFTDGTELNDEEKTVVQQAWSENFDTAFESALEEALSSDSYYDQRGELESEVIQEKWNDLSDAQKFDYGVSENILELGDYEPDTTEETIQRAEPDTWMIDTDTFEGSGRATDDSVREDYDKSRAIAVKLAELRTEEILKERGLEGGTMSANAMAASVWGAWKGSSTSSLGLALQLAAAEELGAAHRLTPEEVQTAVNTANFAFGGRKQTEWTELTPEQQEKTILEHSKGQVQYNIDQWNASHSNATPEERAAKEEQLRAQLPQWIQGNKGAAESGQGLSTFLDTAIKKGIVKHGNDHLGMDRLKAYVRAQWETTQFMMQKAGKKDVEVYRAILLDQALTDAATKTPVEAPSTFVGAQPDRFNQLPELSVLRNGAASTTSNIKVANSWSGVGARVGDRVVLRFKVPASSMISLPVFGQNLHNESEYVMVGTKDPWSWDAWHRTAPTFDAVPIKKNPKMKAAMRAAGQPIIVDLMDIDRDKPHWMSEWRSRAPEDREMRTLRRPETSVHAAADAHVPLVRAAVVKAFRAGQDALNVPLLRSALQSKNRKRAQSAISAVHGVIRASLAKALPAVLHKTLTAGGTAGMGLLRRQVRQAQRQQDMIRLSRIRMLGGPGSGNFGHAGRPGEIGGSGAGGDTKDKKGTIHNIVDSMKPADEHAVFGSKGSIKDIVEHIADAVPGDFTVQLKSGKDVDGSPYVRAIMLSNNNATIAHTYQRNTDGTLEVQHNLVEIPRSVQGQGVGKDLMRAQIEDYQRLGVDKVALLANIDVGGYAWAKYGYTLDTDRTSGTDLQRGLDDNMGKKGLPETVRETVHRIIDEHMDDEGHVDPKVIWKIADMTDTSGHKVGADVLLGADWHGQLNMHDPEALARVRKYIG